MSRAPLALEIVSGGQTGADRAALDAALAAGVPCGGWCPRGRWAEDGALPARYPLRETPGADPAERTRRNVDDADATLVLTAGPVAGGTALACAHARSRGRPLQVVDPLEPGALEAIRGWLERHQVRRLNVAGPRESEAPGIQRAAEGWLRGVLGAARLPPSEG